MPSGRTLLKSALHLTAASMFMRAVGVGFQVYLARQIGAAGIGLFGLIGAAQMFALTVALSGIRFATTRLVSEELGSGNPRGIGAIMRRCFVHALGFGLLAGSFLFFGANWIGTSWIGDSRTILSLRILAVSLPAVACFAVMGGYFTAVSRVGRAAAVQVGEQLLRIGTIAVLFAIVSPQGLQQATALIVAGGVAAELASTGFLFILYLHDRRRFQRKQSALPSSIAAKKTYTRRLLHISMPLAASAYARSGLNTLQQMLIPRGLRRFGADSDGALASYGTVSGMVFPIITFPSALFYAVGEVIVPTLTAAQMARNGERVSYLVSTVLRYSLLISIGLTGLFFAYSHQLAAMIYPNVPEVGNFVRLLTFFMPIMFLDAITDGMLRGLGQQMYSMGVNIVDSVVSVILVWILLPIFGVYGYLFMIYFTEYFNFFFSIRKIAKITAIRISLWQTAKAILCIFAAVQLTGAGFGLLGFQDVGILNLVLQFFLSGALYILLLFGSRCITKQDVAFFRRIL